MGIFDFVSVNVGVAGTGGAGGASTAVGTAQPTPGLVAGPPVAQGPDGTLLAQGPPGPPGPQGPAGPAGPPGGGTSVTGTGLWHNVSGTLQPAALIGAANTLLYTNASATDVLFAALSGDVVSGASPGSTVVEGLLGRGLASLPASQQLLGYSGTAWNFSTPASIFTPGGDLTGNATTQYLQSIGGANNAGGTVNVKASVLAFQQTSSITSPTATTLTIDAPTLHLGTSAASVIQVGSTAAIPLELVGNTVQLFVGSGPTQVGNFLGTAADYLKLGTSQTTQLTPGSLVTTSGALTLTSAAAATWSTGAGNLTVQGFVNLLLSSNAGSNVWTFDNTGQLHLTAASAPTWTIFQEAQPGSSSAPLAGNAFTIHGGTGGAFTGASGSGAKGANLVLQAGGGGASTGTANNASGGDVILGFAFAGSGGSGTAGSQGFIKLSSNATTDRLIIDWNRTTASVLTLAGQQATTFSTTSGALALDAAASATLGAVTATTVTVGNTTTTTQQTFNVVTNDAFDFYAGTTLMLQISGANGTASGATVYPTASAAFSLGIASLYWNGVYSNAFTFPAALGAAGTVGWSGNNAGLTGSNTVVSAQNSSGAAGANAGGVLQLLSGGINGAASGTPGNILLGFGGTTSNVTLTAATGLFSLTKDLTGPGISQASPTSDVAPASLSIRSQSAFTSATVNKSAGTLVLDTGVSISGGSGVIQLGFSNATNVSIGSTTAGATINLNVPVGGLAGGSGTALSFIAQSVALTSGATNTLTNSQYAAPSLKFTGTLAASSTTTIVFPSTDGAVWFLDFSGCSFGASAIVHLQANGVVWSTSVASAATGVFIRYSAGAGKLYGNTQGQ